MQRNTIGATVLGGTIAATVLGVLFVPLFFVLVRRLLGRPEPATRSISARAAAQRRPASECTWIRTGASSARKPDSASASRGRYRLPRLGRYRNSVPR